MQARFKEINQLRAFRLSLRVLHVPVTRALMLVPICPRWHTITLSTTYPTELHASVFHPCF